MLDACHDSQQIFRLQSGMNRVRISSFFSPFSLWDADWICERMEIISTSYCWIGCRLLDAWVAQNFVMMYGAPRDGKLRV